MRFWLLLLVFISTAANAQKEGVEVQKSRLLLLPAATVERSAGQQYGQLMRAAAQKGLLNNDPQQLERLRRIARELLAQAANLAVSLPYARKQESDADLVGLELSARSGHDPRAAVAVWQKMSKLSQGASKSGGQPPQFLSTHPSHASRIKEIETNLPRVLPLYVKATKP